MSAFSGFRVCMYWKKLLCVRFLTSMCSDVSSVMITLAMTISMTKSCAATMVCVLCVVDVWLILQLLCAGLSLATAAVIVIAMVCGMCVWPSGGEGACASDHVFRRFAVSGVRLQTWRLCRLEGFACVLQVCFFVKQSVTKAPTTPPPTLVYSRRVYRYRETEGDSIQAPPTPPPNHPTPYP